MKYFSLLILLPLFSSCYMVRAYKNRKLDLRSHNDLPSVPIRNGETAFHFTDATGLEQTKPWRTELDRGLEGSQTAAFLVIRHDSILYERYFDGFDRSSLLPSFSVVKSFVATLTGIAHDEGKIRSLDEPMTNYLPKFLKKDPRFAQITIQHLLDMRSGLQWNEGSYGLKDDAIRLGFRPNMKPHVYKVKIKEAPGRQTEYQSINTLLLAMIITKATGKTAAEYMSEKIWKPLQMEYAATWNTDKRHLEIAYAGLNATARDFAKLGRLYMREGDWDGKRIVSKEWIDSTLTGQLMLEEGYKNQFWGNRSYEVFPDSLSALAAASSGKYAKPAFHTYNLKNGSKQFYISFAGRGYYALGILGQYIYINPVNESIIVRLGYNWTKKGVSLHQFVTQVSRSASE
jgi:CubicO group peptidase (beta-lactamase class C family)